MSKQAVTEKKVSMEIAKNLELTNIQQGKLSEAINNKQLASQNLALAGNIEHDIVQLICDAHNIDTEKVFDVNLSGNILTVKMAKDIYGQVGTSPFASLHFDISRVISERIT